MTDQYAFWILSYLVVSYFIGYYLIKNELEFKMENKDKIDQFYLDRHYKFSAIMFIISPIWVPSSTFNLFFDWCFKKLKSFALVVGKWLND